MFIRTSGFDFSESYHIVIHVTQYIFSYISIIHYLELSIYVHMLVTRLKSDMCLVFLLHI